MRLERPWVVVWIDFAVFETAVTQRFKDIPVVVKLRNFGRTPAWVELLGFRTWTGLDENFEPAWDSNWATNSAVVLAPGDPSSFVQQVSTISYSDYTEILSGVRTAYVYGVTIYKDFADETHLTRFCYKYRVEGNLGGRSIEGFYVGGPDGYNKYT